MIIDQDTWSYYNIFKHASPFFLCQQQFVFLIVAITQLRTSHGRITSHYFEEGGGQKVWPIPRLAEQPVIGW